MFACSPAARFRAAYPEFYLLPVWLGVAGIWLAMPLSEMFTTVVILGFYFSRRIKLKRL